MKIFLAAVLGVAALAAPALAASVGAQSVSASQEELMHVRTSFNLNVAASYAETAPLFGPEGERAWAGKHWDPQFIHPQPSHDEQGAVCTVKHGDITAVWVTTLFDVEARHYQYVYFMPNLMVTTIDVHFQPIDAVNTQVNVTYARTALTAEGNAHVSEMSDGDKQAGTNWQIAIDNYLAGRKTRP
jgi:hypothetical protein